MKTEFVRFDMTKRPRKTRWYLLLIAWIIVFPNILIHRTKIKKIGMKGVKPPYLLLGNHNAFYDFSIAFASIFPHGANFIAVLEAFVGKEKILRNLGVMCKRKFTNDTIIVKNVFYAIKKKRIVGIYPEARYSLCGTTAVLPSSLGKMCKMLKVPVVTLICNGHHINQPSWNNKHNRKVKHTTAELKLLFTKEQLESASVDEINQKIVEAFQYDDFKWQKENNIKVKCNDRAEGLHRVLYQCPVCKTEFEMDSKGTKLMCKHCNATWEMTELGELKREGGEDIFTHIPDWYEWERSNVKKEIENGTYSSKELRSFITSLPNAKRYVELGEGTIIHDMNGFRVEGIDFDGNHYSVSLGPIETYSCHIEYQFLYKNRDCVNLNSLDDSWYIYPNENQKFSITKIALATEELYFNALRKSGKEIKKGLA